MVSVEQQITDILQKFKIEEFHIFVGPERNFVIVSTPFVQTLLPAEVKEAIYTIVPPSMVVKFRKIIDDQDPFADLEKIAQRHAEADSVNHPPHYNQGKIEVIEFIEDQRLSYHLGNTVKYICRAGKKDPAKTVEDLEKAAWYLRRAIVTLKAEKDQRPPVRPNNMVNP